MQLSPGPFSPRSHRRGLEASLQAIDRFEADHETTLAQFRRDVERARYSAQRAERRYRAVDPENRLVARGLEAEWESALQELKTAEEELATRARRVLAPSHARNATPSSHLARISSAFGPLPQRAIAIVRSCCVRCSTMSP